MTLISQGDTKGILSIEARLFAEKAARSVSEIQNDIVNVSDAVTFLEILGYDDKEAIQHGFSDLAGLANYIIEFIDKYEDPGMKIRAQESLSSPKAPIQSIRSRLFEAVAVQAPWLGALVVLNLTGVSLWMAKGLPNNIATLFVAGVYSGLILSEGLLQMFSRLLFMQYDQNNLPETRRIMLRSYLAVGASVSVIALVALITASAASLPYSYALVVIAAAASVALHRMSFNLLYTLKKVKNILSAYACGFAVLVSAYYFVPLSQGTSLVDKYFISLGLAFAAVSAFSVYSHVMVLRGTSGGAGQVGSPSTVIAFYKSTSAVKNSLKSRFGVQALESIPHFISGLFFFVMMFGDRILSWFFNPQKLVVGNYQFPFAFNSAYHIGADISLFVLVPAAILQYLLISPLYALVQNMATRIRLRDLDKLGSLVGGLYRRSMLTILAAVGVTVAVLNLFGSSLIGGLGGTDSSLAVFRLTSVGNLALAVSTTNLIFLNYLNRSMLAAKLTALAALLVITIGAIFAQYGAPNIAYGYVIASVAMALLSTFYARKSVRNETVRALSRFS